MLHLADGHWWVEAREGGPEGRSLWREYPDEPAAIACVHSRVGSGLRVSGAVVAPVGFGGLLICSANVSDR